jgi:aminoglycoside phosphotransferase (APT) family kinase protein
VPQLSPARLDISALQRYFDAHVPGCAGALEADLVLGGRSNLTYRVTDGITTWAVRRPPAGGLTPSAHDVGREYRIMDALWDSGVAVPRAVSLCTDPEVLGAPFSVVSWVEGRVLRSADDVRGDPASELSECARALVGQLARLHALPYASLGLASFGRPQGYLQRQLRRWRQQWDLTSAEVPAALTELHGRLEAAVPAESAATIVHGDYRVDNLIFATDSLADVRAVVDWELSTLGDPLADLGTLLAYQHPGVDRLLGGPASTTANFPPAAELAREYERASGRDLTGLSYYLGFSYFKIAVIAQGVHARYLQGVTIGDGFSEADQSVPLLLHAGLEIMRAPSIAG